ncbi:MAG TPA: phosphotransferase [Candidatus Saccharimonadales bacterium]|nr:phosphotransferase [Candidatus Saccharimonadales bacterium]
MSSIGEYLPALHPSQRSYVRQAWRDVTQEWGKGEPCVDPYPGSNIVFAVPSRGYVVKMARSPIRENVLGGLEYERNVLDILQRSPAPPPVPIPRPLEYGLTTPHLVTSFVPGHTMRIADLLRTASSDDIHTMGETLGIFMHWLSQAIDQKTYLSEQLNAYSPSFARRAQLNRLCNQPYTPLPGLPRLSDALLEIREAWYDFRPCRGDDFFFGHNDLHTNNFAYTLTGGRCHLGGIFDFGMAQPSSPAQELRTFYAASPAAAETCVRTFERLSGRSVGRVSLRLWATAEHALPLHHIITRNLPNPLYFREAKAGLERIYPGTDWSELDAFQPADQTV